jgi:hypothetical protein
MEPPQLAGTRPVAFDDAAGQSFVLAEGLAREEFEGDPYARVETFWVSSILRGAFLDDRGKIERLRQFFAELAGEPADLVGRLD